MSLPALDDITVHRGTADPIDDLIRIETSPREKATPVIMEMMRSVYPNGAPRHSAYITRPFDRIMFRVLGPFASSSIERRFEQVSLRTHSVPSKSTAYRKFSTARMNRGSAVIRQKRFTASK